MNHGKSLFIGLAMHALLLTNANGQEDPEEEGETESADLLYPAPISTFQVAGGYRFFQQSEQKDQSFYQLTYAGKLIDSKGQPFTSIEHVDLTVPESLKTEGDRSALELKLQDSGGSIDGGLFEGNFAQPITLRGLAAANLRGAAYVSTDLDGKSTKVAVGIESPALRVPGFSKLGAANWLIIGVMGERYDATDNDIQDDSYAVATARMFLGKTFGVHVRPDRDKVAQQIATEFLKKAPTRSDALILAAQIEKIAPNQRSKMQAWIIDLVRGTSSEEDWEKTVLAFTDGIADAVSEQPTWALYLEASGYYGDSNSSLPKASGILSLTADYWPLPVRDDVIVRATYEWGFERLQPTIRVNQITVSAVLQF